jgi:hypothetical protein
MSNLVQGLVTARNASVDVLTMQRTLQDDYDKMGTWELVGKKYGLNRGMVHRIAVHGYDPVNPDIRHKLGLAPRPVPVNIYVLAILVCYFKPPRPRIYHRWRDMPTDALKWALENRE